MTHGTNLQHSMLIGKDKHGRRYTHSVLGQGSTEAISLLSADHHRGLIVVAAGPGFTITAMKNDPVLRTDCIDYLSLN